MLFDHILLLPQIIFLSTVPATNSEFPYFVKKDSNLPFRRDLPYFLARLINGHRRWRPQMLKGLRLSFRTSLFPNLMMDLNPVWYDDRYWSKMLRGTISNPRT